MKRVQFIFLFVLISILILYSNPSLKNVTFAGFACTAPAANSGNPSENSDSCNKEVPVKYLYDGVNTKDWKVELVSGTPTVLIPRGGQTTSAPIYAGKKSGSTSDCAYYTFKFQRGEEELSAELQNIPSQNYVNENGKEICAYDIAQFRDQVITSYFGDATDAKLIIPDIVRTHEPYPVQQNNVVSDGFYVKDETLTTDSQCPTNYEQTFEFIDSSGSVVKHCVSRTAFSGGTEFVYDSYLINSSVYDATEICNGGGIVSGAVFRASNDQFAVLCVDKKVSEDEAQLIINSLITENNCPDGFSKNSEIELNEKTIKKCISSKTAQTKDSERAAKRTDSLSHLDIDVCPDLINELREDTCDNGCCPTQTCEVNIPEGPEETFGFILSPSNECSIDEANQNSDGIGLPITNNENEFVQEGIDQCLETNSEENSQPECGNNLLEDEEECEVETSDSFFFIGSGAKRIVQRNLENSCSIYDSKYSSGILDCTQDCKIDLSKCSEDLEEITGHIVTYTDIIKTGLGGYPEVKVYLDLSLKDVKNGRLPKKAIFVTKIQGQGFNALGDYKNLFIGAASNVLSLYAGTTPHLFGLMKEAQDNNQFIPTGPLMTLSTSDQKTIEAVYARDATIFSEIWDNKILDWFTATVTVTLDFKEDGSADAIVESGITSLGNKYTNVGKIYRKSLTSEEAKAVLLDMLIRFDLAKNRPLGKETGTVATNKMPDLVGIRSMIENNELNPGNQIPIVQKGTIFKSDDTYDKRIDYINPTNENAKGGRVSDFISRLLDYFNSIKLENSQVSASDYDTFIFTTQSA